MSTHEVRLNVELLDMKDELVASSSQEKAVYSKTEEDMNKLRTAAFYNDWNTAYRDVFKEDPLKYLNYFVATTTNGNTLLHYASVANSILFVEELVKYMTEDQLTIKNSYGNTAFFVAALYGRVKFAMVMFERNKLLPSIRGNLEMLPIHVAAQNGHKEMVEFLYSIQGPFQKIDNNKLFLNVMNRVSFSDDPLINEDLEKLYILTRRNDWKTVCRDIFKEDPIENSKYLTARISENEDIVLHVAIETQSFTFAEELIKYMKREDLAIKNRDGNTAFFLAAASKNVRLVKQMFERNGELPNIRGANQMLPIQVATQQGHKLMVEFLNKIQGSLAEMDSSKSFAITTASKNGSSGEMVENVASNPLTNPAAIAIASKNGSCGEIGGHVASHPLTKPADDPMITEIHQILSNAAMDNDWNTAYKDIFKEDPYTNSKYLTAKISEYGNTALHLAAKNNSVEFVKELLMYMLKEELAITNDDGDTAFLFAAENGRMETVSVMFEKNRWLPGIRGYSDDLPIHRASELGHREMVKFLYGIQGPLQENDSNKLFQSPRNRVSLLDDPRINDNLYKIYTAAWMNDWDTCDREIFGGDVSKNSKYLVARISNKDDTALHIAALRNASTFAQELIKYMRKEDLTIRNSDGNTAFFLVAASGNMRLAEKMLAKNVELSSIRGDNEMLPIHKAAQKRHKTMVEFLYGIQEPKEEIDRTKLFEYWRVDRRIIKKLYWATLKGDWKTARKFFEDDPSYVKFRISQRGDIALHIAIEAQYSKFVQVLVDKMNSEDLEIKNHDGNTAFCLAAASGNLELAKKMLDKNKELKYIPGEKEMLPIHMAAQSGHKEMVDFLFGDYLNRQENMRLIDNLIRGGLYGFAGCILYGRPRLAQHREESSEETVLHMLARRPKLANQKQQGIFKRWYKGSDSDKVRHGRYGELPPEALELVQWLWQQIRDLNYEDKIPEIIDHPWPLIFDAVEQENIDFLAVLVCEFPKLTLRVNEKKHSIFHVVVLNRQKEIFKLIDNVGPMFKKSILEMKDIEGNNILHLAGMMPPLERLNNVSGVALQLQQELLWFEEVRQIVEPKHAKAKNINGKTPRDVYDEKITALKDKGEKWMKDTANSCMIVATLITTVVFAAAFTVPGGIKEETGTPNFIQKLSFIIFVISDAISLVSSSCSILTFLSILTARYAEEDFRYVLPRRLVVGLSTLFLSIAAMMVVFCATIFIVFKDGVIWIPILASMIASLPVILFTKQQWRLLYDVARLTFEKSFLSKTSKHSVFEDDDDGEWESWNLKKWKDAACWNFLVKCWNSIHYRCSNFLKECQKSTYKRLRHE